MWIFASPALATVSNVTAGTTHATVADAVAAAVDGDTLEVSDATLAEQVVVSGKRLTLVSTAATDWAVTLVPMPAWPIRVEAGADLTVRGFVFSGVTDTGISVRDGSHVTVDQCEFRRQAMGLYVADGTATVRRSTFRDAFGSPMVSVAAGSSATLDRVLFADNITSGGGALDVDGEVVGTRLRFEGNVGRPDGGAVSCAGTCALTDVRFAGNSSDDGGAIASTGDLTVTRGLFCDNGSFGSIVHATGGTVALTNVAFLDSWLDGGAVVQLDVPAELRHATFVANLGPAVRSTADLTLASSLVTGSAEPGPAVDAPAVDGGWNAWFDNAGGDSSAPTAATDLVGVAPRVSWGSHCAWVRALPGPRSPLRDAGDPAEQDPDGSPADIGALGGPEAP